MSDQGNMRPRLIQARDDSNTITAPAREAFGRHFKTASEAQVNDPGVATFLNQHEEMKRRIPELERQVARHIVTIGIAEGKITYLQSELRRAQIRMAVAEKANQTLALQIGNVAQPLMTALEASRKELLRIGVVPMAEEDDGAEEQGQRFGSGRQDEAG